MPNQTRAKKSKRNISASSLPLVGDGSYVSVRPSADPDTAAQVSFQTPDVQPQAPYVQPQSADPQIPYIQTQSTAQPQAPYVQPQITVPQTPTTQPQAAARQTQSTAQPQTPYIQPQSTAQPQTPYVQPQSTAQPRAPRKRRVQTSGGIRHYPDSVDKAPYGSQETLSSGIRHAKKSADYTDTDVRKRPASSGRSSSLKRAKDTDRHVSPYGRTTSDAAPYSDYSGLFDYMDGKKKLKLEDTGVIHVPEYLYEDTQTQTSTDLGDSIPIKQGTGYMRPMAMKNGRTGKRKRAERLAVLAVIFAAVLAVCAFFLVRRFFSHKGSSTEYDTLVETYVVMPESADTASDYPALEINFASLYAVNNDLIGWIYMPGCGVNFPVVKGSDNAYYTSHNFEKKESSYGAIFADSRNASDFSDFNTFIFGNDMSDGTMFAALYDYGTDTELVRKYPYIYVYLTNGNIMKYRICSFYTNTDSEDSYMHASTDDEKTYYAAMITTKSTIVKSADDTDTKTVSADDRFVTLSTVSKDGVSFIVHGYLEETYNLLLN